MKKRNSSRWNVESMRKLRAMRSARMMIRYGLIPPDDKAVNLQNPAFTAEQIWLAWKYLDLRPSNWRRILIFLSFFVPWVLIWCSLAAAILAFVIVPMWRHN